MFLGLGSPCSTRALCIFLDALDNIIEARFRAGLDVEHFHSRDVLDEDGAGQIFINQERIQVRLAEAGVEFSHRAKVFGHKSFVT